jgi:hypothetical protein
MSKVAGCAQAAYVEGGRLSANAHSRSAQAPQVPATPAAVAAYVERLPTEVLALFAQAAPAELVRRLADAQATAASSKRAGELATRLTPAEYAEEIGADRSGVSRWARAGKVRGWDGRKAPRGGWVEADPRHGARRERDEP